MKGTEGLGWCGGGVIFFNLWNLIFNIFSFFSIISSSIHVQVQNTVLKHGQIKYVILIQSPTLMKKKRPINVLIQEMVTLFIMIAVNHQ